ncbi:MAG: AAA family ATPase, partial [Alphaproteobacteria bacterium]|nr:AAA family ATPase [Alphaproteobacteria bacterium]
IAQGWPDLGDLSHLAGQSDEALRQAITSLGYPKEVTLFTYLLGKMRTGDLVVGIEGTEVRGICEILPKSAYLYDADNNIEELQPQQLAPNSQNDQGQFEAFNYAHCLYPAYWVDWNVVSPGWAPAPSGQGFKGIRRVKNDADAVTRRWRQYVDGLGENLPWTGAWLAERLRRRSRLERSLMMSEIEEIFSILPQVVLYGPPGSGKTYKALQMAAHILGFEDADSQFLSAQFSTPGAAGETRRWDIVQFHPSYNYEDFVRGIQGFPTSQGIDYTPVDRIFAEMCKAAQQDSRPYVLIIDELNRANLSSVLGELLYGLENRERPVRTPYEVDGDFRLIIPENLYVICTMNTADRSIGHLDYALRRRFAFMQCPADRNAIQTYYDGLSIDAAVAAEMRNEALKAFDDFSRLFKTSEGGRAHALSPEQRPEDVQVGHTYFMVKARPQLRTRIRYQVLPLLREYLADGVFLADAEADIDGLDARWP